MADTIDLVEHQEKVSKLNDKILVLAESKGKADVTVMQLHQEVTNLHAMLITMLIKNYTISDREVFISDATITEIELDTFKLGATRDNAGHGVLLKAYKVDELQEMLGGK